MSTGREWTDYTSRQPCPLCGARKRCGIAESGMGMCFGPPQLGAIGPNSNHLGEYYLYPPAGSRPAPIHPVRPVVAAECADLDLRDRFYGDLYSRLSVGSSDRKNLIERGFPEAEIPRRGYKSLPYAVRYALARELGEVWGADTAATVPGWGWKENHGRVYEWLGGHEGMAIRSLTRDGKCAAVRIRANSPDASKYSYLTSANMGGPKAVMNVHHPLFDGSMDVIRITEGELKADLATILSGVFTLGIPGTSSWRLVLSAINALGPRQVLLAFDADAWKKKEVGNDLADLAEALSQADYSLGLEVWSPDYKGIDDLLHAGLTPDVLRGRALWSEIEQLKAVGRAAASVPAVRERQVVALPRLAEVGREAPPSPYDAGEDAGEGSQTAKKSIATRIVELALASGVKLFHTPDETCYAQIPVSNRIDAGTHWETWPLSAGGFSAWLRRLYYQAEGKAPSGPAVKDAAATLAGEALYSGEQHPVYTRIGEHEGTVYINLCDSLWRYVRIDKQGWQVVSEAPLKFRRPKGMQALPVPTQGGSLDELRPFVNVSDDQWTLLIGWLVMAFSPRGPYPIGVIRGGQDCAKSTVTRVLKRLTDPNVAGLRSEPKEERDLAIAAKNSHVIAYDNLPVIYPWLSNALCRVATGGGFATRALYENDEEALFEFQRPILLNGIGEIADKSDLLDRSVLFNLTQIDDTKRKDEEKFWAEFQVAHPAIFGALLDAVSAALRDLDKVELTRRPRMADFAKWVTAAETGLGWSPGTFMDAYEENRNEAHGVALEACPIGYLIIDLVKGQNFEKWEGSAKNLLDALNEMADEETRGRKEWPKVPRSVTVHLKKIAPNLLSERVKYTELPRSGYGRGIRLEVVNPSQESHDANQDSCDANHDANAESHDANALTQSALYARHDASDGNDANSPYSANCGYSGMERSESYRDRGFQREVANTGEFASFAVLRHQIQEWAEENDWMLYQVRGGLPVGGDEAAWSKWLQKATDAQVDVLYRAITR